jgi:hypothetical protein
MFAADAGKAVDVVVGTADVGADRADDAQPARSAKAESNAIASLPDGDRYEVFCIPQGLAE